MALARASLALQASWVLSGTMMTVPLNPLLFGCIIRAVSARRMSSGINKDLFRKDFVTLKFYQKSISTSFYVQVFHT